LHQIGAHFGIERVIPLMYQTIDRGYAVFASKSGASQIRTGGRRSESAHHLQFAGDEAKTTRTIPVVILQPAGEEVRAA
jgi:hypothetical protein